VDSNFSFIERSTMNNLIKVSILFCVIGLIGCTIGNGHICGPQTPQAYCDREAYERLMHPKGIGEYWEKPDKTVEGWRSDWVTCGGRPNGDYSTDTPPRSTHEVIREASDKKLKELWTCMTAKNYYFTGKWRPVW
jgi:hypothetical protein